MSVKALRDCKVLYQNVLLILQLPAIRSVLKMNVLRVPFV